MAEAMQKKDRDYYSYFLLLYVRGQMMPYTQTNCAPVKKRMEAESILRYKCIDFDIMTHCHVSIDHISIDRRSPVLH